MQSIIKYCLLSITFPPLIVFIPRAIWAICNRSCLVLGLQENHLNANLNTLLKNVSPVHDRWPIIWANCWFTIKPRSYSLFSQFVPKFMRLWHFTAVNFTPGVLFWAIDYAQITDSYGFKLCWIEIVTH